MFCRAPTPLSPNKLGGAACAIAGLGTTNHRRIIGVRAGTSHGLIIRIITSAQDNRASVLLIKPKRQPGGCVSSSRGARSRRPVRRSGAPGRSVSNILPQASPVIPPFSPKGRGDWSDPPKALLAWVLGSERSRISASGGRLVLVGFQIETFQRAHDCPDRRVGCDRYRRRRERPVAAAASRSW